MQKQFKKIFILVCSLIIVLSIGSTSLAATNTYEVPFNTFAITPASTWYGSSGYSKLDYVKSARSFRWEINVSRISIAPLTFLGEINIYTQSKGVYKGCIPVSGMGTGKASGMSTIPKGLLRSGTNYTAKFSGIATNTMNQQFRVVETASMNFQN